MTLSTAQIERYSRQIVLPEIGEAGQRRIGDARATVAGSSDAADAAAIYPAAAGVGAVRRAPGEGCVASVVAVGGVGGGASFEVARDAAAGPVGMAGGALAADRLLRSIVGALPRESFSIAADGTVYRPMRFARS